MPARPARPHASDGGRAMSQAGAASDDVYRVMEGCRRRATRRSHASRPCRIEGAAEWRTR